tara:strand:- start:89 stop:325 length:237 start_codon:yes stop_codon:yes gene_type:complete
MKKFVSKRINNDRYGRTVAELFKDEVNIQELIVKKDMGKFIRYTHIYVNGAKPITYKNLDGYSLTLFSTKSILREPER